ncbi:MULTISPECIES: NAD(P)-dependent alcohol dehydrogenase [unclassified Arthrobacter]|uniref:NAD(P)-dependent alcohol dehydrogenase n=1 Tax=unclassified Arthrobacter TaxID=235627 RepID=UPI002E02857E|nr:MULTISPECIES: NAD(P)-dependent alcohol dehydrogenase [unclassified Arthrobacter]MEC5190410.1 aryl-alcohol dehydrogenase [Arthrobacter sp. MP_M4]MEC5201761.1 aryl-alcohol dehydrogenase [Arthrobacter sp. MP_M7]
MKITALVVAEKNAPFVREELDLDAPGPGEVLVRITATGVCHTDANTQAGDMPLPLPGVLGHEGSGVIAAVGAGVTTVVPGDHVVLGWPYCGECRNCLRGEHRYCARLGAALVSGHRLAGSAAGTSAYSRADGTPVSGHFFGQSSFADYSLALASSVVKVDRDLPLELLGPLACGIGTGAGAVFNTAKPGPGESLVIYGAGAVGLAAVMAARNTPAATIVAIDLHDSRLELARELGATHTINAGTPGVVEEILRICGGPADYVLECTGSIRVLEEAAEAVGMLGTLILIGGAPAGARFSLDHLRTLWGKRIVGTLGGSATSAQLIPALISLYRQGRFPFDRLVKFYPLDQIDQAMADSKSGSTIKPVLRIGG